jgi:zinc transport system substrate-binding protein
MIKKAIVVIILLAAAMFMAAPGWAGPLKVVVSIAPQKYFVEKIGGDLVEVTVLVPPGASPHNFEPKPRQMTELAQAGVYMAIGVNFEEVWLDKITASAPGLLIVRTEQGVDKIPMAGHHHHEEGEEHHEGAHEESGEHHEDHGILDPHIWTSPPLVRIQSQNVVAGLIQADPAHRAEYEARYQAWVSELEALDTRLRALFAQRQGLKFLVYHPAWGYLAKTYGLEQVPVEVEGKEPKPAELAALIKYAREQGIKVIFAQPQVSTKGAEVVAKAIGGRVVLADPLSADWAGNLKEIADQFEEALR